MHFQRVSAYIATLFFVAHDRRLTEYMEERQKDDRLQEKSITTTVERSNG